MSEQKKQNPQPQSDHNRTLNEDIAILKNDWGRDSTFDSVRQVPAVSNTLPPPDPSKKGK